MRVIRHDAAGRGQEIFLTGTKPGATCGSAPRDQIYFTMAADSRHTSTYTFPTPLVVGRCTAVDGPTSGEYIVVTGFTFT